MPYIDGDAVAEGVTLARWPINREPGRAEDYAMTIEILYLTHQLQRWINRRVARHLAAQAARLSR